MILARIASCELDRRFVIVDPSFAEKLTSHHSRSFDARALVTAHGPEQLTRDLPNVGDEALSVLDGEGVIRVGVAVQPGTILVGRVTPREGVVLSPEEKLLRAIFGEATGEVLDRSLRAPPACFGTVREAVLDPDRKRAHVVVEWTRPLEVGDVLELDTTPVIVAAIRKLGADLAWSGGSSSARVVKGTMARDVIHARSIGPYDTKTQQATEGREMFGGQRLDEEAMRILADVAPWTAWEAVTIKSDHPIGRTRTYESIVKGEDPAPERPSPRVGGGGGGGGKVVDIFSFFEKPPEPEPGKAFALVPEVIRGISANLAALGFGVDLEAETVEATLLDGGELRRRSRGAVTADTLFDQRIFGPIQDYRCQCGKYARMKHRGVVCEECGVEVIQSRVRRERFAHLELAEPCVHPCFRAEVALLLERSERELSVLTGGELKRSLAQLDLEAIDAIETGPRAELAVALHEQGISPASFLIDTVSVLPPDLRPENEPIGRAYDALARARGRAEVQSVLDELFDVLVADVDGAWAKSVFTKPADYSGVAALVVDPSLERDACRVPRSILTELFKPWAYGILEERGFVTTIKSAKKMVDGGLPEAMHAIEEGCTGWPVLLAAGKALLTRRAAAWDEPAIAVDPRTARTLDAFEIAIHVPLTYGAAIECSKLDDLPSSRPLRAAGWLGEAMIARELFSAVRRAALSQARERIDGGLLSIALGRPPDPPSDDELERWKSKRREAREAYRATLPAPKPDEHGSLNANLSRSVDELELMVRTANALATANIRTIGELVTRTEAELLKSKFHRESIKELKEILAEMGLSLGMRLE